MTYAFTHMGNFLLLLLLLLFLLLLLHPPLKSQSRGPFPSPFWGRCPKRKMNDPLFIENLIWKISFGSSSRPRLLIRPPPLFDPFSSPTLPSLSHLFSFPLLSSSSTPHHHRHHRRSSPTPLILINFHPPSPGFQLFSSPLPTFLFHLPIPDLLVL